MSRQATKHATVPSQHIQDHLEAGRLDKAADQIGRVARTDPNHDHVWLQLARALHSKGEEEAAFAAYRRLQKASPRCALAFHEHGAHLVVAGRVEEAIPLLLTGNSLNPENAVVFNNLGIAYRYLGKLDAARASFQRAMDLQPDYDDARFSMGLTLLYEGEFEAGFALYEARLKKDSEGMPKRIGGVPILTTLVDKPRWDGGALAGKHLLLWAEQGIGDNLMMLRYLPLLRARGAKVTVLCVPALAQVMGTAADHVLVDPDDPLRYDFDFYCPSMSLPFHFGTRIESIPNQVPYLHIAPASQKAWKDCLSGLPGLKVGLVWAGGKTFKRDQQRSMVLSQLKPLMDIEGVHWISLQKGQAAEDLADVDWRVLDWAYHCDDLMDTAALVEQLDLVISVDTSVAHLAGALGKPVWMMSRFEGEWRWMHQRADSPWYPTMRIFHQPAVGDWTSVLGQVGQALRPLAAQSGLDRPLSVQEWAACVRMCATGPAREAKRGFLSRWFGRGD